MGPKYFPAVKTTLNARGLPYLVEELKMSTWEGLDTSVLSHTATDYDPRLRGGRLAAPCR